MDAKQGSSSKRKNKAEKVSPEEKKRRAALGGSTSCATKHQGVLPTTDVLPKVQAELT